MRKALKSCPKSNKSPNLVTLVQSSWFSIILDVPSFQLAPSAPKFWRQIVLCGRKCSWLRRHQNVKRCWRWRRRRYIGTKNKYSVCAPRHRNVNCNLNLRRLYIKALNHDPTFRQCSSLEEKFYVQIHFLSFQLLKEMSPFEWQIRLLVLLGIIQSFTFCGWLKTFSHLGIS